MQLLKTDKGRTELQLGNRTLGQRERALLILADGRNTVDGVNHLFGGEAMRLALHLMQSGYLVVPQAPTARAAQASPPAAPARPAVTRPATRPAPIAPEVPPPAVAADNFEGKRSLATTRMFLFDICERMFARRDPAHADAFRQALRNAKDREAMLAAARDMISAIEAIAGHERADSISERIAMLLPPET
ncbi:hypothetical protein [Rhodoferax sp.]|uniref:hypothetical protein n=1 Tax=Rhodoferax sp. TaxID=50421 RepID=UPI0025EE6EF5|nr:hypothetical protein [Rhodoferax sp.]